MDMDASIELGGLSYFSGCVGLKMGEWLLGVKFSLISAPKVTDALVQRVFFVMQVYLTNVWRLSFTHAAAIMNFWEGMSLIFPALLQFLADTFLGNFAVAVISILFSTLGIGMVALSVPRRLDHGRCGTREAESCTNGTQEGLFYAGMVLTAIGRGGISFSLSAFYDEQGNPESKNWFKRARDALFECGNWGDKKVVYLIGTVIAFMWVTKWKVLFGIPAICSVFAAFVFLCGCCCYKYKCPEGIEGSPLTSVFKVLHTAATSKIRSQPLNLRQKPFPHRSPRCLDRALPAEGDDPDAPKRVETAKFVVRLLLISITFLICGIVSSIGNTYFVEQANHMNRRVGKWNVPLLALQLPILYYKMVSGLSLYVLFMTCCDRLMTVDHAINGIRFAMISSVLCCVTAAAVETRRLGVIRSHGLLDRPDDVIPMHAAWLLLQFFFLAVLDSYLRACVRAFYKKLASEHLGETICGWSEWIDGRAAGRYLDAAVDFVCGLGFLLSVFSVYVVGKLSGWFQYTLNRSRLDRYYWLLAGLSGANLVAFLIGVRYIPRNAAGRGSFFCCNCK